MEGSIRARSSFASIGNLVLAAGLPLLWAGLKMVEEGGTLLKVEGVPLPSPRSRLIDPGSVSRTARGFLFD